MVIFYDNRPKAVFFKNILCLQLSVCFEKLHSLFIIKNWFEVKLKNTQISLKQLVRLITVNYEKFN